MLNQQSIPLVDAHLALAGDELGEPPAGTPALVGRIGADDQAADAGGASAPTSAEVDARGVPFDPAQHERSFRTSGPDKGCWKRKRGNGARKAAGEPPAGAVGSFLARPAGKASAEGSPAGEAASGASSSGPAPAGDQVHEGQVIQPGVRTPEDYEATAEGLAQAAFGIAAMTFGDAWKADRSELDAWREQLKRTFAAYQLPVLGPLLGLVVLAIRSISKRWTDPATRSKVERIRLWLVPAKAAPIVKRSPAPAPQAEAA